MGGLRSFDLKLLGELRQHRVTQALNRHAGKSGKRQVKDGSASRGLNHVVQGFRHGGDSRGHGVKSQIFKMISMIDNIPVNLR